MHLKIPALILLCAAFGWLAPSHLNAAEKKKPAKTESAEPASNPESKKRKPSRREAVEEEHKKLNEQLAASRKELEKAQESLHTAQKELAAKAQAIKSLESKKCEHESALKKANEELKKSKSADFNKLAHTLDDERKKNVALQSQVKELQAVIAKSKPQPAPKPRKPEPKKPEPAKPEPAKPEPAKPEPKKPDPKKPDPKKPEPVQSKAVTVAPIQYDLNSAVNYKERDRVLKELRVILKKSPKAQIQITGYADDTPYKQTNDEVGSNRAKYLLKYLCLSGVPEKQLSSRGIGSAKQGRGDGNRKAVIQIRD